MFLLHPRVKVSIVGSLRDREVACSASDRQGSNFESSVWRTVSSQSSHHSQEVLLAQFSLYVHKGGLKPDSFHYLTLKDTIAAALAVVSLLSRLRSQKGRLWSHSWLLRHTHPGANNYQYKELELRKISRRLQWTDIVLSSSFFGLGLYDNAFSWW